MSIPDYGYEEMNSNQEPIRLGKGQAVDLVLKLLRNIDQVDMSVSEDLEILLRPVSDERDPKEPPTGTATATTITNTPSAQNEAGLVINPTLGVVAVDGQAIPTLTRLEYELLLFLYLRADAIVSRHEISRAIWPDEPRENRDAALEKLVSRVRLKVESDPEQPKYLFTIRGRGYQLVTNPGTK